MLRTPQGRQSRVIPAGNLYIGEKRRGEGCRRGAGSHHAGDERLRSGTRHPREPGTHAGGMLEQVRKVMASLTGHEMSAIYIQDLLAGGYVYSARRCGQDGPAVRHGKCRRDGGDGESGSSAMAGYRPRTERPDCRPRWWWAAWRSTYSSPVG